MRRPFSAFTFPALLLLSLSCAAQEPRIDPARIKAHVEFLASDVLEGRKAGTRGYDVAARYVASQLAQLGARPAGDGATWFQTVNLLEATPVISAGKARIVRDGTVADLVSKEDFLPRAYFSAGATEVTAPATFVGHGVYAPELGHNDFAGVDLAGRIAVVLSGAPRTFPPDQRAHYSYFRTKYRALSERGAIGWISISTPIDEKRVPWERAVLQSWRTSMRWVDAAGEPFDAFPTLKAGFSLSRAGATKVFAGAPASLEQVFANSEAGKVQSFNLPLEVTLSTTSELARLSSENVAGVIEGSDPVLKNEYIVFTSHLDHLGQGAAVAGDHIYNGAFDNATGIAVMLEVARYFAESRRKPRRSLLFLAVTAEEPGMLGSEYFAKHPTVPRGAIVANINMDLPLALTAVADVVAFGAEHSSLGDVTARAVRAEGMAISPDPAPEEVFFVRSDQVSFVREGIPAVFLSMGEQSRTPGVDGAALVKEFRRERYHMPSDDISQPIHYESLAALARINARIGLEVGNARQRPTWHDGDFFGELFAPRGRAR